MRTLISQIKAHPAYQKFKPEIFVVSPPPFGPEEMLIEKYRNGGQRLETLVPEFKKIAEKQGCTFIDNYNEMKGIFKYVTIDGIHLKPEGQKLIATIIDKKMQEVLKDDVN